MYRFMESSEISLETTFLSLENVFFWQTYVIRPIQSTRASTCPTLFNFQVATSNPYFGGLAMDEFDFLIDTHKILQLTVDLKLDTDLKSRQF